MLRLIAVWSPPKPEDRAAFEEAYTNTHAPLARALPGLAKLETILIGEGLEGTPAEVHRIAVMTWPDQAAFESDQQTSEWTALRADAGQMVERFGVNLDAQIGEDG